MAFSNINLARWKEYWIKKSNGSACDCMTYEEAMDLICRLEAAEKVIEKMTTTYHEECNYEIGLAIGVWLKSKGDPA